MNQYYELNGANFNFDYADGYCTETGANDSDIYNIEVEEITEPYEAMGYWLGWSDERQDEYVATFQDWNSASEHAFDTIEDLPVWVYDRIMADLAERVGNLGSELEEALLDAYEPDTFSTWD